MTSLHAEYVENTVRQKCYSETTERRQVKGEPSGKYGENHGDPVHFLTHQSSEMQFGDDALGAARLIPSLNLRSWSSGESRQGNSNPSVNSRRVPKHSWERTCLVSRGAVGLLEGFSPTSVHFKSEINDAFPRKRHQKRHLDFCTAHLRSRGSGVRISPGATLISLESSTCCNFWNRLSFDFRSIRSTPLAANIKGTKLTFVLLYSLGAMSEFLLASTDGASLCSPFPFKVCPSRLSPFKGSVHSGMNA